MKRLRVFLYRFRNIYITLIVIFMFLIIIYGKNDYIFRNLKASLVEVQSFITPKFDIDYTNINNGINNSYINDINNLYDILEINRLNNYKYINSSILSRNVNTYFSEIVIDKGKIDGVNTDLAVVNQDGLIGYISKVYNNHSIVRLLNSSLIKNISVSVNYNGNIYNANITGYDFKNDLLIVSSIRTSSKIDVGSTVITNGYGKVIPPGINVGKVVSLDIDEDTSSKILKVKLDSNLNDLKYVSVIGDIK